MIFTWRVQGTLVSLFRVFSCLRSAMLLKPLMAVVWEVGPIPTPMATLLCFCSLCSKNEKYK